MYSSTSIQTVRLQATLLTTGVPTDILTLRMPFALTHWRVLRAWVGAFSAGGSLASASLQLRSKVEGRGIAFTNVLTLSDLTAAGKKMEFVASPNDFVNLGRNMVLRQVAASASTGVVDVWVEVVGNIKVVDLPTGLAAFWDATDDKQLPGSDGAVAGNWQEPVGGRTITWTTAPTIQVGPEIPGGRALLYASTDGVSDALAGITSEATVVFVGAANAWGTTCPAGLWTGSTGAFWSHMGLGLSASSGTAQVGAQGINLSQDPIEYMAKSATEGQINNQIADYAMYYAIRRKAGGLTTLRYNNVNVVNDVQQTGTVSNLPSILRTGRLGGNYWAGYVFGIMVWPRALTDAELNQVARYIRLKWDILQDHGAFFPWGTSITVGIGATRETSYGNRLFRDLHADGYGIRYSNGGAGGASAAPSAWGSGRGRYQGGFFATHNVFMLDMVTNDIYGYDGGQYSARDPASTTSHICVLQHVKDILTESAQGALGVGWKVMATVPLQRPQSTCTVINQQQSMIDYSIWARANYNAVMGAQLLCDWESITALNMTAGVLPGAYFPDFAHPNSEGHRLMYEYIGDTIRTEMGIPLTPNPS